MWTSDLKEGMKLRADQPFMSTSKGRGLEEITPQTTGLGDQGKSLFGESTMQIGLKPGQNILQHYLNLYESQNLLQKMNIIMET